MKNLVDDNGLSMIPLLRDKQTKLYLHLVETAKQIADIEQQIDRFVSSAYWQSGYTAEQVNEITKGTHLTDYKVTK